MAEKKQRNSSIELLRILSMLGVVILHYNNKDIGGAFRLVTPGSINHYYLYFTETLFIGSVNLFVLISAYFLCKTQTRRLIKVVELIIQVVVFRLAFYLVDVRNGMLFEKKNLIECLLPVNYFVILYSVIYILSPYFNVFIQKMNQKQLKKFLLTIMLLFSVWTFLVDFLENYEGKSYMGLSTIGMYGSQYGYSIVNFVLLYFVGAYIQNYGISLSKKKIILVCIGSFLLLFASTLAEFHIGLVYPTSWYYNNPVLIVFVATLLYLFAGIDFYNKVINELAGGAFTCFLVHTYFLKRAHVEEFINQNFLIMIGHQILVAVVLYLVSYIVYKIYKLGTGWFMKLITPIFDKMNISLEE